MYGSTGSSNERECAIAGFLVNLETSLSLKDHSILWIWYLPFSMIVSHYALTTIFSITTNVLCFIVAFNYSNIPYTASTIV